MPTGTTIVTNALTILGIVEQGGTPSASDAQDGITELNQMWDAWGIDEGLIFAVQQVSKALTAATASMTIGSGATWNIPVPNRVYKAFITTTGNRNEIKVVSSDTYFAHNDLTASATTPDEVYIDFNVSPTTGFATVYTWPVQSGTPTLELTVGTTFTLWDSSTNIDIPQGFQDAITYALAWRLINRFGMIVPQTIQQSVAGLAEKAELRIREMTKINRQLPAGAEMLQPPPQPGAPRA